MLVDSVVLRIDLFFLLENLIFDGKILIIWDMMFILLIRFDVVKVL